MKPVKFKIYQTVYNIGHYHKLEKCFVPYNNLRNDRPELREYPLMMDLYEKNRNFDGYWGLMSPLFREKAGMTGQEFIKRMTSHNTSFDVYHTNPHFNTGDTINSNNPFHQGEWCHPGMLNFINTILARMGYDIDIGRVMFDKNHHIFCSYYVGTNKFWEPWLTFAGMVFTIAEQEEVLIKYLTEASVHKGEKLINFSFVFERLVNLFLFLHKEEYKICRI